MGLERKADYVQLFQLLADSCKQEFVEDILKPTGRNGALTVRDYTQALCLISELRKVNAPYNTCTSKSEALKYLHPAVRFRLKYFSPCLAYRYDELKDAAKDDLFDNAEWLATEKENGIRGWFIHYKGQSFLFSRNYSDVDCGLREYWGNVDQYLLFGSGEIFAVDVEIKYEADSMYLEEELLALGLATTDRLSACNALLQLDSKKSLDIQRKYRAMTDKDLIAFRLIFPLFVGGVDYMNRQMGFGHSHYDEVVRIAQSKGLNMHPIRRATGSREKKTELLTTIFSESGEGVVFHNLRGMYNTTDKRDKTSFVKLKRTVGASASQEGLGDSFDGFITGFKLGNPGTSNENLVSAFELTIHILKNDGTVRQHVIAYPSNLTDKLMTDATIPDDAGNPTLNPKYLGMVVEVNGQAISKVNKRITHPRMLRFRFDKSAAECTYSETFINSQMV